MIRIQAIQVDVPFPCDACGSQCMSLAVVKFINFNKGLPIYLCYRCKNVLHSKLGKFLYEPQS
jgi:hypothetical protein